MIEYSYEEGYPDCIGDTQWFKKQPGCLTCIYKGDCEKEIKKQSEKNVKSSKLIY